VPANRFEVLATWYLRFNGYFTTANFSVHPDFRNRPGGTDADIIAVRFPHSREYQRLFDFDRDTSLIRSDRIDFLICEVKSGLCDMNQNSWRNRERENVEYTVRWMGFERRDARIQEIADEIYRSGARDLPEEKICVRFVCFGRESNPELSSALPGVQQILHEHVIGYLKDRFSTGCYQITRENWDEDIIEFAAICGARSVPELLAWASEENAQRLQSVEERIRRRAYELYLQRQSGSELVDWLQAEREILSESP
jgi:hypothetical protein